MKYTTQKVHIRTHNLFHYFILLLLCVYALNAIAAPVQTTQQALKPPQIGQDGRLILPAPQLFPRLPTTAQDYFKKHNAYYYHANLSQYTQVYPDKVVQIGNFSGYTIMWQKAYDEIASLHSRTPKWPQVSELLKQNSGLSGALWIGEHKAGDYGGTAYIRLIDQTSSYKNQAFKAIQPEIQAHNQFLDQVEQYSFLSPQERAKLIEQHRATGKPLPEDLQAKQQADLEALTIGISRVRMLTAIGSSINGKPIDPSEGISTEELIAIGKENPELDSGLETIAQNSQRTRAEFEQNQQDSLAQAKGEKPSYEGLNSAGQTADQLSGLINYTIGDRANAATSFLGINAAINAAYNNLPPQWQNNIQAAGAAAHDFAQDNPNFAAVAELGAQVIPAAKGIKGALPSRGKGGGSGGKGSGGGGHSGSHSKADSDNSDKTPDKVPDRTPSKNPDNQPNPSHHNADSKPRYIGSNAGKPNTGKNSDSKGNNGVSGHSSSHYASNNDEKGNASNESHTPTSPKPTPTKSTVTPDDLVFRENLAQHLINDGVTKNGINGTHNDVEFHKVLAANGGRIISATPRGDGIVTYKYEIQVPLKDRTGQIVGRKPVIEAKTTYDPSKYSDAQILDMAKRAAAQGYEQALKDMKNNSDKNQYTQTIEGVEFKIYLDKKTGDITNVHPI